MKKDKFQWPDLGLDKIPEEQVGARYRTRLRHGLQR